MSREIVLAGACRTAIGKMGGALAGIPVAELGAVVVKEAVKRAGVKPDQVDEVFMGCVLQGAQGQNVARQSAVKAGLPVEVPAQTLNIVCGSGLKSVNLAAAMIATGEADVVVAGGMENMSSAVYAMEKARFGYRMGDGALVDTMIKDALWDAFNQYHMGVTAENVAERYGVTRAMQDAFAASSQQKCEAAQKAGKFKDEIVPVPVKVKKETIPFEVDEYPRSGVTVESIAGLSPAFKPNGTVTAANASGINDGAAAVVVLSAEKAKALGVKPMARWIGGATAGVDPAVMGIAPAFATRKLLEKTKISLDEIELIEANEAFAAQAVAVGQLLNWDAARVNVNGGAIALGHPVGASGCRILVTLLHEMLRRGTPRGLATLCIGGGMGVSTLVELVR
ncbi:MAG: acetyl-CoA C-acetyltransferase [Synergistaceae bacterium]|nr:acetyl-CoA C-acetyltransferase [Synergistaceae bacterium]